MFSSECFSSVPPHAGRDEVTLDRKQKHHADTDVTDSSVTALEAIFSLYLMIGILAALERTVLSDGSTAFASDLIRRAATGSLRPSAALVPGASWESNLCRA
ncbi:hypothetical protein ROHU_030287 [Labeo rohita]|uniref:Uncharacterized protein n=1 Tax=Labeo rohita TaxID=84645 RepID=A0A498LW81_LABRO|nr:hypothetical protein ROHU_030287 [Labeo rohita]